MLQWNICIAEYLYLIVHFTCDCGWVVFQTTTESYNIHTPDNIPGSFYCNDVEQLI